MAAVDGGASSAASGTGGSTAPAPFTLPKVHFNPTSWGPVGSAERYDKVPFAAFNKGDRVGKCADFGGWNRYAGFRRYGRGEENVELTYKFDVAEAREFVTVEAGGKAAKSSATVTAVRGGRGGMMGAGRGGRAGGDWRAGGTGTYGGAYGGAGGRGGGRGVSTGRGGGGGGGGCPGRACALPRHVTAHPAARARGSMVVQGGGGGRDAGGGGGGGGRGGRNDGRRGGYRRHINPLAREPSVRIGADWLLVEQAEFAQLNKLSSNEPEVDDVRWTGSLQAYDEEVEKINSKTTRKLRRFDDRAPIHCTAKDDAVLQSLTEEGEGNVFATDGVLTHLMACTRATIPWDIVITVLPGGVVFLDARDAESFEAVTVSETAHVAPPDEEDDPINNRTALSTEGTAVDYAVTQQVLLKNSRPTALATSAPLPSEPKADGTWPLDEEELKRPPADVAFRYRKFSVSKDVTLVCRTTVHAVHRRRGATVPQYLYVRGLHEWDPTVSGMTPWKTIIDNQRGNLLAQEVKNNANRLAKYTLGALLAGADSMKIGMVSRVKRDVTDEHTLLGVHSIVPSAFAMQLNLLTTNGWGILRWLVSTVRRFATEMQSESDVPADEFVAKFVLLRNPVKPLLELYNVPQETFATEEGEGEEEWEGEAPADTAASGGAGVGVSVGEVVTA